MKNFAKNLVYLRKKAEIKQDEAAAALGYTSRSRLANYEGGHSLPSLEDFLKIAEYYKVSLDDLVYSDLEHGKKKVQKTADQVGEPNETYNSMYIESLETRVKTLSEVNKLLSTNNEQLTTNNDKLLAMLKAQHGTTVKTRINTRKDGEDK